MMSKLLSIAIAVTSIIAPTSSAFAADKKKPFSAHTFDIPFNITQKSIAANVTPHPGDEIIVVGADEDNQKWLAIFHYDLTTMQFVMLDQQPLPKQYFSLDIGDGEDGALKKIYLLAKDHIVAYQPNTETTIGGWHEERKVSSMLLIDEATTISNRDFARDINNDGVDDFILPDFTHTNLWVSHCCQQHHYQTLPISPLAQQYDRSVNFQETKLYFVDVNNDSKTDIVKVNQGQLEYFAQKADQSFNQTAASITISADIYGLSWQDIADSSGQDRDQSNLSHRRMMDIKDINGDNKVDLIVQFEQTSGVLDRVNDYEIYFAQPNEGPLQYSAQADTRIQSDVTLLGLEFVDLNNDKKLEAISPSFELGLGTVIGALISGSADMEYQIFNMDNNNSYGEDPLLTKDVEMSFSLSSGRAATPFFEVTDINGDNLKDIVFSDGTEKLRVLYGSSSRKKQFAKRDVKFNTVVPSEGGDVLAHDVNGDGKSDMIMHFGTQDEEEMSRKVKVLIAI